MAQKADNLVDAADLPRQPIQRLVKPVVRFLHVEAAGGIVLLICTITALFLANFDKLFPELHLGISEQYLNFWKTEIILQFGEFGFHHSLKHIINDGLMVIFFFVVGLEVKRELVHGELRDAKQASLPIAAAVGGMIAPALIYLSVMWGQEGSRGWGIPMATDIAFVVGCMALLGPRVPHSLRIMLLSLAIVDDIGAILVIAIGYTSHLALSWLAMAGLILGFVFLARQLHIRSFLPYIILGVIIWFDFHESGIHATIAGVILGLMTPARRYVDENAFARILDRLREVISGGDWEGTTEKTAKIRNIQWLSRETISPLEYLERTLHPWSSFVIMPIFALANAGVPINLADLGEGISIAIILGLVIGKPLGITLFCWLLVKSGLGKLPNTITWPSLFAGGCLAGIGFTMALFIAGLALEGPLLDVAKIGVLAASTLAAVLGMVLLLILLPSKNKKVEMPTEEKARETE